MSWRKSETELCTCSYWKRFSLDENSYVECSALKVHEVFVMTVVPPGVRETLRCPWMCFTGKVPSKKMLRCANIPFSAHAFAQPCRHTTSKAFQAFERIICMGVGRGSREALTPWILKLLAKKVLFSISRGKNQISPFLALPWKKVWEYPLLAPPGKNPSDAHGFLECCKCARIWYFTAQLVWLHCAFAQMRT